MRGSTFQEAPLALLEQVVPLHIPVVVPYLVDPSVCLRRMRHFLRYEAFKPPLFFWPEDAHTRSDACVPEFVRRWPLAMMTVRRALQGISPLKMGIVFLLLFFFSCAKPLDTLPPEQWIVEWLTVLLATVIHTGGRRRN